jgi:hypothetical protein
MKSKRMFNLVFVICAVCITIFNIHDKSRLKNEIKFMLTNSIFYRHHMSIHIERQFLWKHELIMIEKSLIMSKLTCFSSRNEYTIKWIVAFAFEQTTAIVMLDEKHDKSIDFEQFFIDSNSYIWDCINENNIVIISLLVSRYEDTMLHHM